MYSDETETEPVRVSRTELEQLRLMDRRFKWLLGFWTITSGQSASEVLAQIDDALALGHSPADAAGIAAIGTMHRTRRGHGQPKPQSGRN